MKKRGWTIAYAALLILLTAGGMATAFCLAMRENHFEGLKCLEGIIVSLIASPILHELGHICMGKWAGMRCVYAKFFCFRILQKDGKRRLSFASPFAADQTQMIPVVGGNMKKRALRYAVGGLLFEGIFFLLILVAAVICLCFGAVTYKLWGMLPYAGYLFFLNAMPAVYGSGKTDALVCRGIRKDYDAEKCMLSAMEIHGQLSEGKSFSEIDEGYYFDLPQLAEDEPLFALLLDLRYRYYLDKGDMDAAADCLNRLARSQEYLSDEELESVAAELVYMHARCGDLSKAEESGRLCQAFLAGNGATAKRILIAYSIAAGKTDTLDALKEQAKESLAKEQIAGVKKFEEKLLSALE